MEKKISRKELEKCDGKDGRSAYLAYNGIVYDVTHNAYWIDGEHFGSHLAGVDLTSEIDNAPHGEEVLRGAVKVGILED